MSSIGLFLKVTHACNLKCSYCYDSHFDKSTQNMKLEDVYRLIDLTAEYYDQMHILFHGGEPWVRGLDFYRSVHRYALERHPQKSFKYSMQSNATLIDKEKINLIRSMNMNYSFSFDGLSNSLFRGGTEDVLKAMNLLKENNYDRHVVTVANQAFLNQILEEYQYAKSLRVKSIRINNLFGPEITEQYNSLYVNKMLELFDYWKYDINPISITQFESLIETALGRKEQAICSLDCHKHWIGMDYDGLIGLCDFGAFPRSYNLGKISDFNDVNDILYQPKKIEILGEVTSRFQKCFEQKCELAGICSGGCNAQLYREFGRLDEIGGSFCFITRALVLGIKEQLASAEINKLNPRIVNILKSKKSENGGVRCNQHL